MEVPIGVTAASCLLGGGCYCANQSPGNGFTAIDIANARNNSERQRTSTPYCRSDMMSKDDETDEEEESPRTDTSEEDRIILTDRQSSDGGSHVPFIAGKKKKKSKPAKLLCGF